MDKRLKSKLQKLATSSDTARVVFSALASRERNRDILDIRRFKQYITKAGHALPKEIYAKLWQDMEAIGLGRLIKGQPGAKGIPNVPDHFEFSVPVTSIGEAVREVLNVDDTFKEKFRGALYEQAGRTPPPPKPKPMPEGHSIPLPMVGEGVLLFSKNEMDKKAFQALKKYAESMLKLF